MKRILLTATLVLSVLEVIAVPAHPGWRTFTTADGLSIELQQQGDEYGHWWSDHQGKVYTIDADGQAILSSMQRPALVAQRADCSARKQKKLGVTPNLAPRGLVILANYADKSYQAGNTQAEMDSMMNGLNYTHCGTHASVREYFKAQSDGKYIPHFDVIGPVTVSRNASYYGENDYSGNDKHSADLIVEACTIADTLWGVDFTIYDNDGDGYIDFVYVLYAGKGEADGGASSTIWPHNWSVVDAQYYGMCTFTAEQSTFDGVRLNNYACSGEQNGSTGKRNSIGTIAHEFGHVLGLPDFYDTQSSGWSSTDTPDEWDIMASGSYNGTDDSGNNYSGTCPPNYSPWEKAFFGWIDVINPGDTPSDWLLYANGTEGYGAYQVNASGIYQSPTDAGVCYYIENRQQIGWDRYLPDHGLLVWKVSYDVNEWESNTPNTSSGSHYICSLVSGTSWTQFSKRPVTNIREVNQVIFAQYMGGQPVIIENPLTADSLVQIIAEYDIHQAGSYLLDQSELTIVPTEAGYNVFYHRSSDNQSVECTIGGEEFITQAGLHVLLLNELYAYVLTLTDDKATTVPFFSKGIIYSLVTRSDALQDGQPARLYYSEDGTSSNRIYCPGLYYQTEHGVFGTTTLAQGDTIIVLGSVAYHSLLQPRQNGYIYAINPGNIYDAIHDTYNPHAIRKEIRNGQLIIIHNNKEYTLWGTQL